MKPRLLALAGLAALISMTGCDGAHTTTGHANYRVSGIAGTNTPLVGVPVTVTDGAGHRMQSSVTDAHGHYTIELKGAGPFVLTAPFNDSDGTPATLSAVIVPSPDGVMSQAVVNLNPLTTLLTQRVLSVVLHDAPNAAQMTAAGI